MPHTVLPAEWAPQSAVQLSWPHRDSEWITWLDAVEANIARIGSEVSRRQYVLVVCRDADVEKRARAALRAAGATERHCIIVRQDNNDTWARDHAPLTVLRDGQAVLLDFQFNGWGGKYPHAADNAMSAGLASQGVFVDTPMETVDLILEGGSIESDGEGTLLTTTDCLLNPNRNGLDRQGIERRLSQSLGFDRFLWLEHGHMEGDDTDSHIDTMARFCDAHTIAYQGCDDPDDVHFAPLKAMAEELRGFRTRDGRPYDLVELPLPSAMYAEDGHRLPAGYANFLIINEAVLVPVYGDPMDAPACERLAAAFPNRQIVPVNCRTLIEQHGSLHCSTMQYPAQVRLTIGG